jgi:gluconokinase
MGVAGCGKSTVGTLLASRLDVPYAEADVFHPPGTGQDGGRSPFD